jgi:Ca2+-binding RTX toxin-like protein
MATQLGIHLHTPLPGQGFTELLQQLQKSSGDVGRLDGNWATLQGQPAIGVNPAAFQLSDQDYAAYLTSRGFGDGGANLASLINSFREAGAAGVKVVYNFGVVPTWAQGTAGEESVANPSSVGEALQDLLVYIARQPDRDALFSNLVSIQLFNEINLSFDAAEDRPDIGAYFTLVEQAFALTQQTLDALSIPQKASTLISAPNLSGAYDATFWDAFFAFDTKETATASANGDLDIGSVALHPYGSRPITDLEVGSLLYGRVLMPTDDASTAAALINRDPARTELSLDQSDLATLGPWNSNAESGIEITLARLAQQGASPRLQVQFTEFGASTYLGDAAAGTESLFNTTFADPYKYGNILPGSTLTDAVADNLQAETIAQTLGLIDSWDFVSSATVYEAVDQDGKTAEGSFGLAEFTADANGQPVLKPAGAAFAAYAAGTEFNLTGLAGDIGTNIHIAAEGEAGTFDQTLRNAEFHEVVLLREGDDQFDAAGGDDIIFAGAGNDGILGGAGYDRLYGGLGDDALDGGAGDDKIVGGGGNDTMTGGEGADNFSFSFYSVGTSGNTGSDIIRDFNVEQDTLTLIGGYSKDAILADATLRQAEGDGLRITLADNAATLLLEKVTEAQFLLANIISLQADATIGPELLPNPAQKPAPTPLPTPSPLPIPAPLPAVDPLPAPAPAPEPGLTSPIEPLPALTPDVDQPLDPLPNPVPNPTPDAEPPVAPLPPLLPNPDETISVEVAGETAWHMSTAGMDVLVINGSSADYGWGLTENERGTVVWNLNDPETFDILVATNAEKIKPSKLFEIIRFNDRDITLKDQPDSRFKDAESLEDHEAWVEDHSGQDDISYDHHAY